MFIGPHLLLPTDNARHVGEAVAMVVADSATQALDAAETVAVDYQLLPGVYHSEDAMRRGRAGDLGRGAGQRPDRHHVRQRDRHRPGIRERRSCGGEDFHIERVTGVPLEPRAALGCYEADSGRYTLYAGSGGAVRQKREIAAVLGIVPERVRVLSCDVGGNYGTRNRVFVEFGLVSWAARKLGRPVKFTATRSEAFLSDYQGRDLVTKVELALVGTAAFSPCAPPISAMSAPAASRFPRSPKARG